MTTYQVDVTIRLVAEIDLSDGKFVNHDLDNFKASDPGYGEILARAFASFDVEAMTEERARWEVDKQLRMIEFESEYGEDWDVKSWTIDSIEEA